jgi:signal transduction histidine kinase
VSNDKDSNVSAEDIDSSDYVSGRELEQLSRFAASLGATMDVDTLVKDAVEPLVAIACADDVLIVISRTDARLLIPQTSKLQLRLTAKGLSGPPIAALGTEAVAFDSMESVPKSISSKFDPVSGFVAIVPLWAQAHLRGAIILLRKHKPFTVHVLKMLTTAGRQFALAVENSRLLSDLQDSYRKLMDAQEDLIRAERLAALGQLSATMAHEIRNPLTTIFSAISQIRKHGVTKEISDTLLDIAEEEATRLNNMVTELLKFARPRKPVFHNESILDTVKRGIDNISFMDDFPENVTLVLNKQSEDFLILHDSDLFEQALKLLIDNSIDAFEGKQGNIEIMVTRLEHGGLVTVSDNGTGIPDEQVSKIFEPFYSTRPTGTGLGLPTVKRIAEDHRGSFELVST